MCLRWPQFLAAGGGLREREGELKKSQVHCCARCVDGPGRPVGLFWLALRFLMRNIHTARRFFHPCTYFIEKSQLQRSDCFFTTYRPRFDVEVGQPYSRSSEERLASFAFAWTPVLKCANLVGSSPFDTLSVSASKETACRKDHGTQDVEQFTTPSSRTKGTIYTSVR
jgi:hypothetical protein